MTTDVNTTLTIAGTGLHPSRPRIFELTLETTADDAVMAFVTSGEYASSLEALIAEGGMPNEAETRWLRVSPGTIKKIENAAYRAGW